MILADVIGTVTATQKDAALGGKALLLCAAARSELVAVDTVGAGVGDQVLITTGSAARLPGQTIGAPVDATIVAVVDTVARS